jgi:DNA polymerase III alpha subunit (gram-positive type)
VPHEITKTPNVPQRQFGYKSGGLSKVAKELDIDRIGTMHQAGSDSLITMRVFFKLKDLMKKWWNIEDENILEKKFNGLIYGLG